MTDERCFTWNTSDLRFCLHPRVHARGEGRAGQEMPARVARFT